MLNILVMLNSILLALIFLMIFKGGSATSLLMTVESCWSVIIVTISLFSVFFSLTYFLYLGVLLVCFATVEFTFCLAIYYTYLI